MGVGCTQLAASTDCIRVATNHALAVEFDGYFKFMNLLINWHVYLKIINFKNYNYSQFMGIEFIFKILF